MGGREGGGAGGVGRRSARAAQRRPRVQQGALAAREARGSGKSRGRMVAGHCAAHRASARAEAAHPGPGGGRRNTGALKCRKGEEARARGILSWGREKRSGLSRSRLSTFCCCIKKCLGVLGVYGAQDRARPTAHAPTLGRPLPAHYRLTPRQPPPRPSPPPPKKNLALRAAWGMVADAARHAGAAADAVPGARALVPWWRRATRWRQTSDAEGRAAEAGLIALRR